MHEWNTKTSTNILSLVDYYKGFEFETDYSGRECVEDVEIRKDILKTEPEARDLVTRLSYGSNTAYLAAYSNNKITKAYQSAFDNFLKRRHEYLDFDRLLNIGYGRKSSKVTCPDCGSSINLHYGKRFKKCPVCKSTAIISDSNWKVLKTKSNMMYKASEMLQREAEKCGVTFICGIEWHC